MFPVPSILSALEILIDAQLMLVALVKGADPVAVICCMYRMAVEEAPATRAMCCDTRVVLVFEGSMVPDAVGV